MTAPQQAFVLGALSAFAVMVACEGVARLWRMSAEHRAMRARRKASRATAALMTGDELAEILRGHLPAETQLVVAENKDAARLIANWSGNHRRPVGGAR